MLLGPSGVAWNKASWEKNQPVPEGEEAREEEMETRNDRIGEREGLKGKRRRSERRGRCRRMEREM